MALSLDDFKRSNLLVSVFVVSLVVLLLLLPDILGIEGPTIKRSGYARKAATQTTVPESRTVQRVIPASLTLRDGLNAEALEAQRGAQILAEVRSSSEQLMFSLPEKYRASRFALLSLLNGLDRVQDNSDGLMAPEEALVYLNNLDRDVAAAFYSENVPDDYLRVWKSVGLGSAVAPVVPSTVGRADRKEAVTFVLSDLRYYRQAAKSPEQFYRNPLLLDATFTLVEDGEEQKAHSVVYYLDGVKTRREKVKRGAETFKLEKLPAARSVSVELLNDKQEVVRRRTFNLAIGTRGRRGRLDKGSNRFYYQVALRKGGPAQSSSALAPLTDGRNASLVSPLFANRGSSGFVSF